MQLITLLIEQGFNYWYVRNYTFDGSAIELDIKIYQNTCAPNNLQAQIVSTGVCKYNPLFCRKF